MEIDSKIKMLLVYIFVCFSALLQTALSTPVLHAKPKPVELSYSCLTIIPPEQQDFKPSNVPIILLHGIAGNKESWHGILQLLALETRRKVCAADLRNHGASPWNDEEYDVEAMTEDIKHMLDKLEAPKAILLGHSLGGKITVHLALNYPDRVEKMIIEDIRPNGLTDEDIKVVKNYAKVFVDLEKYIPQGVTEMEAKKGLHKILKDYQVKLERPFLPKEEDLPIKCVDGKCQWTFNTVLMKSFLNYDVEDLLTPSSGRFDGPALFIYGGKSPTKVGDDESNIKKFFPNAKLVEVEEAYHMVHTFKKFKDEVIKFINEN